MNTIAPKQITTSNFMSKFIRAGLATVALAAFAGVAAPDAKAVVFDFAGMASGAEGLFSSATVGGLTVTATATNTGTASTRPWLDDVAFGGKPAGLGACSTMTASGIDCNGNDDDNVNLDSLAPGAGKEMLTLSFSIAGFKTIVNLGPIQFRDQEHQTRTTSVIINGSSEALVGGAFGGNLVGQSFSFMADANANWADFYIQTVEASRVPEAATLGLFGLGLAGLGLAARRRKTA